jgi:hypothetical protein
MRGRPTKDGRDWIESEPGLRAALGEVARLFRRTRARRLLIVGLALAGALTLSAKSSSSGLEDSFSSKIVFRITENDTEEASIASRPPREFKRWITAAAFAGPRLTKVIERHHLYPALYARDPQLAVETMREDIDIIVWRNYFLWDYLPEGEGDDSERRSVRVAIAFHARDPELAYDVVRDLGQLIIDLQEQSRLALAEEARLEADAAVQEARAAAEHGQQRIVRRQLALMAAPPGTPQAQLLRVEIAGLRPRVKFLDERARQLDALRNHIGLREGIERQQRGLLFELVDHGAAAEPPVLTRRAVIALVGLLCFLALIPLLSIVIGAFDPRILDLEDVRRLGLAGLGQIAAFDGDDLGSMKLRRRRAAEVH